MYAFARIPLSLPYGCPLNWPVPPLYFLIYKFTCMSSQLEPPSPLIKGEGGVPLFYYFTVQSHLLSVAGKLSFLCITFRVFSLFSRPCKILIQVFIVLKPDIICTFLVHFGSLQKMLTALFSLVWNTQKSKWTNFF